MQPGLPVFLRSWVAVQPERPVPWLRVVRWPQAREAVVAAGPAVCRTAVDKEPDRVLHWRALAEAVLVPEPVSL